MSVLCSAIYRRNYIKNCNIQRNYLSPVIFRHFVDGITARKMPATNPIEQSIKNKLSTALDVQHLDVMNESYMHNVPKGAETHFKVVIVSDKFKGVPLLQRHRLVNQLLQEELQNGVHALSIVAKTPEQWNVSDKIVEPSPNCRGGFGK